MVTFNRWERLDIDRRGLITGSYGFTTDEFFIGQDLRKYSRNEALHSYLVGKGYEPIIFFDPEANGGIYSYSEKHLQEFINPGACTESTDSAGDCILEGIETPFGPMTKDLDTNSSPEDSSSRGTSPSSHPGIIRFSPGQHSREFFKLKSSPEPFPLIQAYTKRFPERKLAFVFENPGSVNVADPLQTASLIENMKKYFSVDNYGVRIIVLYPERDLRQLIGAFSREVAGSTIFYSHTMAIEMGLAAKDNSGVQGTDISKDELQTFRRNMFYLGTPERDELTSFIADKRLSDTSFDLQGKTYDGIIKALLSGNYKVCKDGKEDFATEEDRTLAALSRMDFASIVQSIDTGVAREKLLALKGQEKAAREILKFNRSRLKYRRSLENGKKKARKRMHKLYLGDPGTGKTTAAVLDAQDMRDIGLLSKGHCVFAKVGDLEGEFVGQTRVKTQAMCDKANGGVLVLDEAYGLFEDTKKGASGSNIYGKEAIEVLIQNMENNLDFAVILLGYEDDMKDMMKGNRGFPSRVDDDGWITFESYSPENLFEIAVNQLPPERTAEFDETLLTIIRLKYSMRNNVTWGNAREAERMAGKISDLYDRDGGEGPVTVKHIPEEDLRMVDTGNKTDEEIFAPLEGIVGQQAVKESIRDFTTQYLINLIRSSARSEGTIPLEPLSFIFRGNPGSGKTTVASKMGEVFSAAGILSPGKLITVGVDEIVSGVPGQTEEMIQKMVEDNIGNVIFIDEAYMLARYPEALNKITALLTDTRFLGKYAIILAGYTDHMQGLLDMNQGLESRFAFGIIDFPDYSIDELWEILLSKMKPMGLSFSEEAECERRAKEWFTSLPASRRYANGRKCEILIREMNKLMMKRVPSDERNPENLSVFVPSDIPLPVERPLSQGGKSVPSVPSGRFTCDLSGESSQRRVTAVTDLDKAVGLIETSSGKGTGFIISCSQRLIMTCYHVIKGNAGADFRINALDGKDYHGDVVWTDPVHDAAIIRASTLPDGAMYLGLRDGNKDTVAPLTPIIVCGFPMGEKISRNLMINGGEVNNYEKGKQNDDGSVYDIYFSSIPATHGNSGGPALLKDSFEVFGLLQGGLEDIGPVGVRIISDLSPIYGESSLEVING